MTAAYKIALAAAAMLLVLVVALLLMTSDDGADPAATGDDGVAARGGPEAGVPDFPRQVDRPEREPTVTFGEAVLPGDDDTPGGGAAGNSLTIGRAAAGSDPFEMQASPLYADTRTLTGDADGPRSRDEAIDLLEPDADANDARVDPLPDLVAEDDTLAAAPLDGGLTLGPTDAVDRTRIADALGEAEPARDRDVVSTALPLPVEPVDDEPEPTPRTPQPATTHTIASGETFSRIAVRLYGDEKYWVAIAQANPLIDPERLRVGQEIRLPSPAEVADNAAPAASDLPDGRTTYTVKSGDSLSEIAQQFYGNATQWRRIHEANRSLIGSDPTDLRAGMKLTIPPPNEGAR